MYEIPLNRNAYIIRASEVINNRKKKKRKKSERSFLKNH